MNISKKEVIHVAKLAELDFTEEELEKITGQLDRILGYIASINKADTKKAGPTSHSLEIKNIFREDKPKESLTQDEALSNAPEKKNGGFMVPKID